MAVKIERWEFEQRLEWPLETKIQQSLQVIEGWYYLNKGQVYVSFSGGKDSTVLLNLVRSLYPDVPAVFVDTGLEYPEIKKFVKSIDNVIVVKPSIPFFKIIKKYGYPVVSKEVSSFIHEVQHSTERGLATRNLRLTGYKTNGEHRPSSMIPKKWQYLLESGFPISDKCCDFIKKKPLKEYQKETGMLPYIGTMAVDSSLRKQQYLKYGCNSFDIKSNPRSTPIGFWKEEDVWSYIKVNGLKYSEIYDLGYERTGCMFCMFGVHMEKEPNRFQRMKLSHPKQHDYCINKLGCGKVLDEIGVNYEPNE